MSAVLLSEARADGVHVTLGDSGKLRVAGHADAVHRWRERIAAAKPEIIEALSDGPRAQSAQDGDGLTDQYAKATLGRAQRARAGNEVPPAMLEDLAERVGIIADNLPHTPDAQLEAERDAARLVQCRTCARFTPDSINPLSGIGTCAVDAWPQSTGLPGAHGQRQGPLPWPMAPRHCRQWIDATAKRGSEHG